MKNIVIVESPAKAKTIEKFLGEDYKVESSFGHIRDLTKKNMGIDIEANFEPSYEISAKSRKVIANLKQAIKNADLVWLATDEDREGEAIAWHLAETFKLNPQNSRRITFNEITKNAVRNAIENPRQINYSLVDAQQARRVVDRLVGFELSPVLWKKVRTGLSAGRVQSVSVRLIIERERQREAFTPEVSWKIEAHLNKDKEHFIAQLENKKINQQEVEKLLENLKGEKLTVEEIIRKPGKRSPSAPFTTSSLQQTAAQVYGFSIKMTMSVAQQLYENGLITYMRTDSTHLSDQALLESQQTVKKLYGQEYHTKRVFKSKLATAQEAHEAIRPSRFEKTIIDKISEPNQRKLYELIWKRTMSSQMADAVIQKTTLKLSNEKTPAKFLAIGEQIDFPGWLVLNQGKLKESILPKVAKGEKIDIEKIEARQIFSRHPARYTEGSLVRQLEELGIGRPSTYSPTISTIQERGYIEKKDLEPQDRKYISYQLQGETIKKEELVEKTGGDKRVLVATDIAYVVNDFLVKQFSDIVDYQFTAKLEKTFDNIVNNQIDWKKTIGEFYKPFHEKVLESEGIERQKINNTRYVGKDPATGKPVSIRLGRYGPFAQIGEKEDEEKPKFASLRSNHRIENITLEEALKLFELPKVLGNIDQSISYTAIDGSEFSVEKETPIKANIGRFGPYLQIGSKFVSLKNISPEDIDLPTAIQLIDEHLKKQSQQLLAFFGKIRVLEGRWGAYLNDGKKNAPLPKGMDLKTLDEKKAKSIIKEKGKPVRSKVTKTKSTTKNKK